MFKEVHFHSHTNNRALPQKLLILDFFLCGHPGNPRRYFLEPPTDMRRIRQSTASTRYTQAVKRKNLT